ncbi:MAG TPA: MFS transporter [Streptosporangiaceae bacterium]|jgi:EmrB/QacA subfamily drug resistance transporter
MRRRWWILVAVSLATFMTYLDNNVTNVAIPTIERSLHLSIAGLEWVVSSYILVFASLLLFGGRMADIFGRRRLFLAGLSIFTLASLFAGLATSGGVLIGARLVQGLGAALLVPTTLAIIMATFDNARERTRAIGAWTAIGAMGLAFGPLIGGYISQHFHWGWIFFINVPIGVVTLAIAVAVMRESRDTSAARRLDVPGLVSSALALFALVYALIEGHDKGWTSPLITGCYAVAAIAAAAFVVIESRSRYPMVSIRLFRSRVFGGGTTVMMLWAFGILGIYFFTSIYLQTILGFSPTKAGLAFVPMAICMAIFASLAPQVAPRLGAHRTVALGMAAMSAGLYLFAGLGGTATFGGLMPGFLMFGAGAGLMNVPLTNVVLHSMPPERSGVASALLNASREVAGLLGITVIGAVLRAREGVALQHGASAGSAFLTGYHDGLLVTVALLAFGALAGYLALRTSGNDHAAPDLEATLAAELAPPDDAASLGVAPARR